MKIDKINVPRLVEVDYSFIQLNTNHIFIIDNMLVVEHTAHILFCFLLISCDPHIFVFPNILTSLNINIMLLCKHLKYIYIYLSKKAVVHKLSKILFKFIISCLS